MIPAGKLSIFKPNMASLGYALFLAVNATGVWGGIFPFLPLDFQTPTILFWFFLAQSVTFFASYLASGLGVYFLPGPTRFLSAVLAGVPYLAGWCCLIAAMYCDGVAVPLVTVGGAFLGLGSAGFYMLWQRLFASRDADTGNRDLILGTAYAALFYYALYLVPRGICAFLIPLVFMPLFGLAIVLQSRTVDREQPMFQDVPREHPHVYREVIRTYWRSALCLGALGFCTGIMRSLALGNIEMGTLVNALSMAGALLMAVTVLVLWQFKSIRMNVVSMYRTFFPLAITSFVLLPFAPNPYGHVLAAVLYAVYSAAIMLMMIQCAQASRDAGINPVFVYGLFGAVVYALHDLGFFGGTFVESAVSTLPSFFELALVALTAVYLLSIMNFIGQGGFRRVLGLNPRDDSIELVALEPPASVAAKSTQNATAMEATEAIPAESEVSVELQSAEPELETEQPREQISPASTKEGLGSSEEELGFDENLQRSVLQVEERRALAQENDSQENARRIEAMREHFRLSARETEVMELIVDGYTVPRIAEKLVVSENTVRTHSKRIYAKLGVHKKQELRDLLKTF